MTPSEAGKTGTDKEIRALKIVTGTLTAVPLLSGLAGALGGPAAVTGRGPVDASTDSEFRFLSGAWFATAPLVWSVLPTAERQPWSLRIIGVPALLAWHTRIVTQSRRDRHPRR